MTIFLIWLVGATIVGAIARSKDKSFVGFFLTSIVLSPLIGLIVVLVGEGGSKCPICAETIKTAALKCRYCGNSLSKEELKSKKSASASGLEGV